MEKVRLYNFMGFLWGIDMAIKDGFDMFLIDFEPNMVASDCLWFFKIAFYIDGPINLPVLILQTANPFFVQGSLVFPFFFPDWVPR